MKNKKSLIALIISAVVILAIVATIVIIENRKNNDIAEDTPESTAAVTEEPEESTAADTEEVTDTEYEFSEDLRYTHEWKTDENGNTVISFYSIPDGAYVCDYNLGKCVDEYDNNNDNKLWGFDNTYEDTTTGQVVLLSFINKGSEEADSESEIIMYESRTLIAHGNDEGKAVLFDVKNGKVLKELSGVSNVASGIYDVSYVPGNDVSYTAHAELDDGSTVLMSRTGKVSRAFEEGELTTIWGGKVDKYSFEDNAIVVQKDGKYGIEKIFGEELIIDYDYDEILLFPDGKFTGAKDGERRLYSLEGEALTSKSYDEVFYLCDNTVIIMKDKNISITDFDGNVIAENIAKVEMLGENLDVKNLHRMEIRGNNMSGQIKFHFVDLPTGSDEDVLSRKYYYSFIYDPSTHELISEQ